MKCYDFKDHRFSLPRIGVHALLAHQGKNGCRCCQPYDNVMITLDAFIASLPESEQTAIARRTRQLIAAEMTLPRRGQAMGEALRGMAGCPERPLVRCVDGGRSQKTRMRRGEK